MADLEITFSSAGVDNSDGVNKHAECISGEFTTTATSAEVNTNLKTISFASVTPTGTSVNANDVLAVSKTVTNGKVTITRPASGTSGLTFNVFLLGEK